MNIRRVWKKLENLRCLMFVDVSKANEYLRSSEMVCFELDWWPVGIDEFQVSAASPDISNPFDYHVGVES
jgi:hypothetical protein